MNSSNKIGTFYYLVAFVLGGLTGASISHWMITVTSGQAYGIPSGFGFLFGFGYIVMIHLWWSEHRHSRSAKWYNHGPEPVLVK